MRKKNIIIEVGISENNVIENISCHGDDIPNTINGKAMLFSLFDKETLETIKIDLWTTDLEIQEMDRLVFQSLRGIADTYYKATKNNELASELQAFIQHFGLKTEILTDGSSN